MPGPRVPPPRRGFPRGIEFRYCAAACELPDERGSGAVVVEFPGENGGFAGEPEPFAQTLRSALTEAD